MPQNGLLGSLSSSSLVLAVLFVGALCAFASGLIKLLIRQALTPLRRLRSPPSASLLMGNLAALMDQENNYLIDRWVEDYGPVLTYHGFLGGSRLLTTDIRAISHILGNAYDYPKPDFVRDGLASMVAGHDGLVITEGEQHTRQRKIIQPAFSSASLKAVTPAFWEKAAELRDIWIRIGETHREEIRTRIDMEKSPSTAPSIDVLAWLGRATLDVIGLAGFGYSFNSLTDESNVLAQAFAAVFCTATKFRYMIILATWFPILRRFRKEESSEAHMRTTIHKVGLQLIKERGADAQADVFLREKLSYDPHGNLATSSRARDLLSLLMRSNFAAAPHQQMTTQEILCQISTFIAAGHETTSAALTWTLYALALHPEIQSKLRASFRSLSAASRSAGSLNSSVTDTNEYEHEHSALEEQLGRLPYLEWVVREALRVYSPVVSTFRVCAKERDAIPVGGDGYLDKDGVRRTTIEIKKGDIITVPLQAINRCRTLWGCDARDFRPERWESPPESRKAVPGLWSNVLTFLNGNPINGNRSCIGYKFALTEIKIFLYVLLRDLEFSIDPDVVIEKKINVVLRPCVKSEPERGNQMPLLVKRVQPDSAAAWFDLSFGEADRPLSP